MNPTTHQLIPRIEPQFTCICCKELLPLTRFPLKRGGTKRNAATCRACATALQRAERMLRQQNEAGATQNREVLTAKRKEYRRRVQLRAALPDMLDLLLTLNTRGKAIRDARNV